MQHAHAELAIAFDGDGAGVRQLMRDVSLELDALLEVDQVELDLLGTVPQRQIRDDHVQQGRLARAGFAGDQRVLCDPASEPQVLQPDGAGMPERDAEIGAGVAGPTLLA